MKIILTLFFSFLFCNLSVAQNSWRENEMEIKVYLKSQQEAELLEKLNFNSEAASADGKFVNLYVTPEELGEIIESQITYEISIPDLNSYYLGFWNGAASSGYMSYEQIVALADSLSTNYPGICKKVSFGQSLGLRQLAALKISDNVFSNEMEAGIMFDGGIHGDELLGPEIVIRYARNLCQKYGSDSIITDLINKQEIWIYYMVNPDGRAKMRRYNNNFVDLNRDAGYMWNATGSSSGAFSQVESQALRNCILLANPVVYINYHAGFEVIGTPWCYRSSLPTDNIHLNQLASLYSDSSGYASLPYGQSYNIMYGANGTFADFQYGSLGNVGFTIEVSVNKQPDSSEIDSFYNKNAPSMTEMIKQCGKGIEGYITDSVTGEPIKATIWINNYYPVVTRTDVGDYHKYLLPGIYNVKVQANGYKKQQINNVLVPSSGSATLNIQMIRDTGYYAVQVVCSRILISSFSGFVNAAVTPNTCGANDNAYYALWKGGWILLDMGDTIFDGPGNDFTVIEAGQNPEGFSCFSGGSKDGPWTLIGSGIATTSFDLANAEGGTVTKTRYLRITDDGDGSTTGTDPGYDLDAIKMITKPLIAAFTTSDPDPCSGIGISFTDQTAGAPTEWLWEFPFGNPSTSTDQSPQNIIYNTAGTFDVSLKVTNAFCSNTKTKTGFITVQRPSVDLGNDTSIIVYETLILHAGNPGSSYLWSTGETTESIEVDSSGTGYGDATYWVNVTDTSGCNGNDSITITYTYPLGVEFSDIENIRIYPNPAKEFINIEYPQTGGIKIRLISSKGIIFFEKETTIHGTNETIYLKNFGAGIYFLEISSQGNRELQKIIIL